MHTVQYNTDVEYIGEIRSNHVSTGLPPKNNNFIRHGLRDLRTIIETCRDDSSGADGAFTVAAGESRVLLNTHKAKILSAALRLRHLMSSFRRLPSATMENGSPAPRVFVLARAYLLSAADPISSEHWVRCIQTLSLDSPLSYAELVLATPALQLAALLPVAQDSHGPVQNSGAVAMQSVIALVSVLSFDTDTLLEQLVAFEPLLCQDPARVYPLLDAYSKRFYWDAVIRLAELWNIPPGDVCRGVISLCARAEVPVDARQRLKAHIGYHLIDSEGVELLANRLGVQPRDRKRMLKRPSARSCALLYVATTIIVGAIATVFSIPRSQPLLWQAVIFTALVIISAQTAEHILTLITRFTLLPYMLPRLHLAGGLPVEYTTIIAFPSLLWGTDAIDSLKERLKTHYAAVRDDNALLVLLTDFPDCSQPHLYREEHASLLERCSGMVRELNDLPEFSASKPFFFLHRDHYYSYTQRAWIGWERKRGKLHQLVELVIEGTEHFHHIVGDVERLRAARYMLVLDDHSLLTEYSLHQLVGTAVHPLNHPHLDLARRVITRGYGILQPALQPVGSNNATSEGSRARRDVFQDTFQQSGYWGKGLINIEAYHELLRGVIPEERILSHDVIETALVRTASASGIRMLEGFSANHSVACRRRHRWIRGDWQNLAWLLRIPRQLASRTSIFGRLLILQNILNSISPMAMVVLLLAGVSSYHALLLWCVLLLVGTGYTAIGVDVITRMFRGEILTRRELYVPTILIPKRCLEYYGGVAHEAALSLDAIIRTIGRLIGKRKLLEWEPSSSFALHISSMNVCRVYRYAVPAVCSGIVGLLLLRGHPPVLTVCLLLWWSAHSLLATN
jgi:hypothetical protein